MDPSTLTLRGVFPFTWVVPVKVQNGSFQCKSQDNNNDGLLDLVCQFDIPKNTLSVGETKAVLDGQTFQGDPIHSSHFIEVH